MVPEPEINVPVADISPILIWIFLQSLTITKPKFCLTLFKPSTILSGLPPISESLLQKISFVTESEQLSLSLFSSILKKKKKKIDFFLYIFFKFSKTTVSIK
jgi:hypothetical protein